MIDNEDAVEEQVWFTVSDDEAGHRIDKILAKRFEDLHSRSYLQRLIADGNVVINQSPVKKRIQPVAGDEIGVTFVLSEELTLTPENIPLTILYEDEHLLVINKPAGMVVHPAPGHWTGTFVNALMHHCQGLEASGGPLRPGIVHRLDKDTTGVLIAAKTALTHQKLVHLFATRQVYKEYVAICVGSPGDGVVDAPIGRHPRQRKQMAVLPEGGRAAITKYWTLAVHEDLSFVRIELTTGRTHQARVHMRHRGMPVLGDPIYGSASSNLRHKRERQMLHAQQLRLTHPITGASLSVTAPLPPDMANLVDRLFPSVRG